MSRYQICSDAVRGDLVFRAFLYTLSREGSLSALVTQLGHFERRPWSRARKFPRYWVEFAEIPALIF